MIFPVRAFISCEQSSQIHGEKDGLHTGGTYEGFHFFRRGCTRSTDTRLNLRTILTLFYNSTNHCGDLSAGMQTCE